MDEDASYFESHPQLLVSNVTTNTQSRCNEETTNEWSTFDGLDDSMPHEVETNNAEICKKCFELEVKLQKSQVVISKLQKRCAEKSAQIKRLRASEKRSKLAKKSLEDLLQDIKEKKWISDEGQNVLNVNNTCIESN